MSERARGSSEDAASQLKSEKAGRALGGRAYAERLLRVRERKQLEQKKEERRDDLSDESRVRGRERER